jgi:hypothetical protein
MKRTTGRGHRRPAGWRRGPPVRPTRGGPRLKLPKHIHIPHILATAGAVSITTAVSITIAPYAAVFGQLKFIFRLFSFFAVNFKQIHTRNKKKKFENKMSYWLKKSFKK